MYPSTETRRPGRNVNRCRPYFEELEMRAVPSASAFHSIATATSSNWSGYSVAAASGSAFTSVSGSWVVPAVTSTGTNSYSSFWVGLDGFDSNSVEQLGTDSDISSNGRASYYAWWEMYPNPSHTITTVAIHVGDTINASVTYIGNNQYTLSLTNVSVSPQQSFTTTQTLSGAARSSAEWIAEAPSSWSGVLPLANYGSMTFSNATATSSDGTTSTSGPIDSSSFSATAITMQDGRATSTPGSLTDSGTGSSATSSFTMTANVPTSKQRHSGFFFFSPNAPSARGFTAVVDVPAPGLTAVTTLGVQNSAEPLPSLSLLAVPLPVPQSISNWQPPAYPSAGIFVTPDAGAANVDQNAPPADDAAEGWFTVHVTAPGHTSEVPAAIMPAPVLDNYFGSEEAVPANGGADISPIFSGAELGAPATGVDMMAGAEIAAIVLGAYAVVPPQEAERPGRPKVRWL